MPQSTAYLEGQQAFLDNFPDNPYAPDTDEHEDWIQGWQEQWYQYALEYK